MNPGKSLSRLSVAVAILVLFFSISASAESMPDTENGRYALSQAAGGVIRLDTRTGAVSNCNNSPSGWSCFVVPDERRAMDEEIGRLQAENEALKAQLASRDPGRKIEIPLPSDHDVDRVMSFLERAWRKLIDMANRVQKDVSGKI
jgi:hypothetical protein